MWQLRLYGTQFIYIILVYSNILPYALSIRIYDIIILVELRLLRAPVESILMADAVTVVCSTEQENTL